jgi:hypothetical protein
MTISSCLISNFQLQIMGCFWMMFFIMFAFFVLGKRWGWAMAAFSASIIAIGLINRAPGYILVHFNIPESQIIKEEPSFLFLPFLLIIYGLNKIVATRKVAEEQIRKQKKDLEEQKLIVDRAFAELGTKQKEIMDSIHYAHRIQKALITNDLYISKELKRLKK